MSWFPPDMVIVPAVLGPYRDGRARQHVGQVHHTRYAQQDAVVLPRKAIAPITNPLEQLLQDTQTDPDDT